MRGKGRRVDAGVATIEPAGIDLRLPDHDGHVLGSILTARHGVAEAAIDEVVAQQEATGQPLGRLLVERGLIDAATLAGALAEQFGLDVVDLGTVNPSSEALAVLDAGTAHRLSALPLTLEGNELTLAVSDPTAPGLKAAGPVLGRFEIRFMLASEPDLRHAINLAYPALATVSHQVEQFEATRPISLTAEPAALQLNENAPVVQVVNAIVTQALRDRASDVHIEPQADRLRVRFRVDGAMREALTLPATMSAALVSRLKIMADMNIVEQRRPQDGQFALDVDGRELDVRVATAATIWGEKAVLRLLDRSRSFLGLAELGMPKHIYSLYSRVARSPFGMVICSGPTGSGKTTTLYATLNEVARADVNVTTIEDPVEYVFPNISQIQINEQAGLTFATGLRSILRQDPDIILVGEMRDGETARIAVQAALTGHLVLSSLHAIDSAAALSRLADMGVEPFLVASSVVAVVAQRLVRRICRSCQAPYTPTPQEMTIYQAAGGPKKDRFFQGAGCTFCSGTGYR
ncbi:MAG: ATPase, T2SS/T4P/T4SS family, partial [Acidimicrobiia bacterium]|nr:ATPase, T2SS/T4P/T4SS family [Acidimicrobiia bacterium]